MPYAFFTSGYVASSAQSMPVVLQWVGSLPNTPVITPHLFYIILYLPVILRIEDQFSTWPWTAHWTSLWVHFCPSSTWTGILSVYSRHSGLLHLKSFAHTPLPIWFSILCSIVPLTDGLLSLFPNWCLWDHFSEPPDHVGIPIRLPSILSRCTSKSVVHELKCNGIMKWSM